MLNEGDAATVKYLRNSPKDALKKEAADLIEKLARQLKQKNEELNKVVSRWRQEEYFRLNSESND